MSSTLPPSSSFPPHAQFMPEGEEVGLATFMM